MICDIQAYESRVCEVANGQLIAHIRECVLATRNQCRDELNIGLKKAYLLERGWVLAFLKRIYPFDNLGYLMA
jgi:hypothetical protein